MPKRQTRRGGAFVRKGSYGCAFAKPPLKCQGEAARRPSNELSKLLEYKKAYEEYQESIPFKRIDPEKKYFLWAHHMCPLDQSSVVSTNQIGKCIQKNRGQSAPTVNIRRDPTLIFYDFGGSDISDIVITSGQYGPFFMSFGNLLQGLSIMHYNHIAHLDIKPLNIVSMELPSGEFSTRFIDFGLAVGTASGTETNPRILGLSPQDYPWWPFEFRFLSRPSPVIYSGEVGRWYSQIDSMKVYFPQSSYWNEDWTPKYDRPVLQSIASQTPWRFREHVLRQVDVYALGVSLAEVYASKTHHFMRTYGGRDTIVVQLASRRTVPVQSLTVADTGDAALVMWHKRLAETVSMPFFNLIKKMIDVDVRNRIMAAEAAKEFMETIYPKLQSFFTEMDLFTTKALEATGIRVVDTRIRLQSFPTKSLPSVPKTTAASTEPQQQKAQLENILRQARDVIGVNDPSSAEKPVSAATDPRVSNIAPLSNMRIRRFGNYKKKENIPPVVARDQIQLLPPRLSDANLYRRGIAGPHHTGVNILRKLSDPVQQKPVQAANPFYVAKNVPAKQNTTRKLVRSNRAKRFAFF